MVTEAEMNDICGSFRRLSTKKIGLFPDTLKVLDALKRNGKKIYMLSNAQYSFTMHEIRNRVSSNTSMRYTSLQRKA